MSELKELSCTLHLYYSSNGNSFVVFERAKNLCLSINQLSMKRPCPGGFFLTFNTVDTLDADENTKIKFSHKERLIYALLFFVACNYSFLSIFCTRREKNPFHWE